MRHNMPKRYNSHNGITVGVILFYLVVAVINIAWIGTLIWAIIYVVTHLGGWLA